METWRPVPGWGDAYEASDLGGVRSVDREISSTTGPRLIPGREMSIGVRRHDQRRVVSLSQKNHHRHKLVSNVVWAAFVGPVFDGDRINEIDGDLGNLSLPNLELIANPDRSTRTCSAGHVLARPNLVSSLNEKGKLRCRACNQASAYVYTHPELDMKTIAHERYVLITAP